MTRGGKSRCALCALTAAALALGLVAAAPAVASAPGVDEYQLNLPNGGGSSGSSTPDQTTPTTTTPAVTPTVPVTPTVTTPTVTTPVSPTTTAKRHKPNHHHVVVLGSTSVNAKLGPEQIPSLKVRATDDGTPWLPIGIAALIAACCLLAVWRLRYLRELPTAPRSEPAGT